MDTPSEDTMVRQIEKKLSDHMNENLFLAGRSMDNRPSGHSKYAVDKPAKPVADGEAGQEYPLVSYEHISNSPGFSRAEYIRQAREACLRQLSSVQLYSNPYDVNYMEPAAASEELNQKKARVMKLFGNSMEVEDQRIRDRTRDVLSYRSLIIRSVCAIVLFLSIFLLDKFQVKIGDFTPHIIQEYVTGNDALEKLENIIVTWLK